MLIEVHILQNHAPSNLNRDDTGSPKEAIFGGFKRARISSQCLKRSLRRSEIFTSVLSDCLGTRTRSLPELVKSALLTAGLSDERATIGAQKVTGFGNSKGTEKDPSAAGYYRTEQTMFFTQADVTAISEVIEAASEAAKDEKAFKKISAKDLQKQAEDSGCRPISVDIALFGRMVTSEAFVNVEASSQFAHAISTHKIDHEFDYFTAVDDLDRAADDDAGGGADMIGDVEFNSACYYKYFNIHLDGLIENLTGRAFNQEVSSDDEKNARETAGKAVRALIEATCRVTPSGKQNTFAAHQPPSLIWIEIRDKNLPVSYANAFCNPINPKAKAGMELGSAQSLKKECETLTKMYGLEARKRFLLAKDDAFKILNVTSGENLKAMLDQIDKEVQGG